MDIARGDSFLRLHRDGISYSVLGSNPTVQGKYNTPHTVASILLKCYCLSVEVLYTEPVDMNNGESIVPIGMAGEGHSMTPDGGSRRVSKCSHCDRY